MNTLYSHNYDNGLKLMEHSYVGNNFVNAVVSQIVDNLERIAWMGDYANDRCNDPWEKQVTEQMEWDDFSQLYKRAMEGEGRIKPDPIEFDTGAKGWFLVNHTKHVYINMDAYIEANKWHEEGMWNGEHYSYDMCIHPLPLLTACGNDRGGGDYHDCYPNIELVGSWAFDLIEMTKVRYMDYEEVTFEFTEQRKVSARWKGSRPYC